MARLTMRQARAKQGAKRPSKGFTLAETLLALLIVTLLTGIVATGVPIAINAYKQVVDSSNAQVALSTTTSALRDELGLAVDVKPALDGTAFYQRTDGNWVMIDNGNASSVGLVKHVYPDAPGGFNPNSPGVGAEMDLVPSAAIAGAKDGAGLRVQMTGTDGSAPYITYDADNGVFTVHGVEVLIGGSPAEGVDEYKVKAVIDSAS